MARVPPYAKALLTRRASGERIGLLIVSASDWHGGEELSLRAHTARVVVPDDVLLDDLDWSFAAGLDCLVCGNAPEERFYAIVQALHEAGAASLWGEFEDGIALLEHFPGSCAPVPFLVDIDRCGIPGEKFGSALAEYRRSAIRWQEGFYAAPAFAGMHRSEREAIEATAAQIRAELAREAAA
jgi:hypothetical protein